jgi:hypothetical protein
MTFEHWQKKFEQFLRVGPEGEPAGRAFDTWCEEVRTFQESASRMPHLEKLPKGNPYTTTPETYVLHRIYYGTLLPSDDESRKRQNQRKRDEYTCKELDSLARHAERFVVQLRTMGSEVSTDDGYFALNLGPLLQLYTEAAQSSRVALSLLRRPYLHKADILDQCLGLFATLTRRRYDKRNARAPISHLSDDAQPKGERLGIPEPEAVALVYLALRAHGFKKEELASLDPLKVRDGNVRKRLDSRIRRVVATANVISARTRKK